MEQAADEQYVCEGGGDSSRVIAESPQAVCQVAVGRRAGARALRRASLAVSTRSRFRKHHKFEGRGSRSQVGTVRS